MITGGPNRVNGYLTSTKYLLNPSESVTSSLVAPAMTLTFFANEDFDSVSKRLPSGRTTLSAVVSGWTPTLGKSL